MRRRLIPFLVSLLFLSIALALAHAQDPCSLVCIDYECKKVCSGGTAIPTSAPTSPPDATPGPPGGDGGGTPVLPGTPPPTSPLFRPQPLLRTGSAPMNGSDAFVSRRTRQCSIQQRLPALTRPSDNEDNPLRGIEVLSSV